MNSQIEPRFKLKVLPILVTAALGYGVPYLAGYGAFYSSKIFGTPSPYGPTLGWLYMQHAFQLLLALIVIGVLKFRLVPADYGLHWPQGKSYIWPAILWGGFFGVLMTVVDYARMAELVVTYGDLPLGTTDASVIALAERLKLTEVATLDRPHFTVVRPNHVNALALLP